MATTLDAPPLTLSYDDRVLLRAISLAGDSVRDAEIDYLLARWPWESPMDLGRVGELAEAGLLQPADDGWFVPLMVDAEATAELPIALDPLLRGFVGEMLCRGADSMERLQLGVRRMIAGGREQAVVDVCRAWGESPAGQAGPRGARFVEALGAVKLGPVLQARLRTAVPELAPERRGLLASLGSAGARLAIPPKVAYRAAAAVIVMALHLAGQSSPLLERIARQ